VRPGGPSPCHWIRAEDSRVILRNCYRQVATTKAQRKVCFLHLRSAKKKLSGLSQDEVDRSRLIGCGHA